MNIYKFTAHDKKRNIIKGQIRAMSAEDAALQIAANDLEISSLSLMQSYSSPIVKNNASKKKFLFLTLDEKILLTSQLETIIKSGISVLAALEHVMVHSNKLKIREICKDLVSSVRGGSSFSEALDIYYPNTFGNVYISIIKAGEESGKLEIVLGRIVDLLKKQQKIKGEVISALIYPCILLAIMIGLISLFGFYIYPKILEFLSQNGVGTPPYAKFLYDFFRFIRFHLFHVISSIVLVCCGIKLALKNIVIRTKFDKFLLNIPLLSQFITFLNLDNAMILMYIAYGSGVSIVDSMELAMGSINNVIIKNSFARMIAQLKQGKSISDVYSSNNRIPDDLSSMISAGDISGKLTEMFKDCADYLDERIDNIVSRLSKLIGPFAILMIGCIVAIFGIAIMEMYVASLSTMF